MEQTRQAVSGGQGFAWGFYDRLCRAGETVMPCVCGIGNRMPSQYRQPLEKHVEQAQSWASQTESPSWSQRSVQQLKWVFAMSEPEAKAATERRARDAEGLLASVVKVLSGGSADKLGELGASNTVSAQSETPNTALGEGANDVGAPTSDTAKRFQKLDLSSIHKTLKSFNTDASQEAKSVWWSQEDWVKMALRAGSVYLAYKLWQNL